MPKASATNATARFQRPAMSGRTKKRSVTFSKLLGTKRLEHVGILGKKRTQEAAAHKLVATTPLAEEHALFVNAARAAREGHVAAGHTVIAWSENGERIGVYGPDGKIEPFPEGSVGPQVEASA